MLLWENVKLALSSLRANKMRALLTMLGIIIGIGAVIAIMTVSASLTASINQSFQEMGANNITVGLSKTSEEETVTANGMRFGAASRSSDITADDRITDEMIADMRSQMGDYIVAVSCTESVGSGTAEVSNTTANVSVTGINEEYFESNSITLLAGRKITAQDSEKAKRVIMVSDQLVETLYDGDNDSALAQKLSLNIDGSYTDYYIVGVYQYESSGTINEDSDSDITTEAYIPLQTAKDVLHADDGYTQFTVVTSVGDSSVSELAEQIETILSTYYVENENYEITTATMESMTESMTDMVDTVATAIAFIAGISLLVGGIGVMNIMLVSVTERTREIGTRKALGARNASIRLQFVIESVVLCVIGGILGIVLGLILGAIAAAVLGYQATAPLAAIFVAVGFSMLIGIFFGYYPANKAAKLNPIEALRYE
jgi:putative ABC transport system permease protein